MSTCHRLLILSTFQNWRSLIISFSWVRFSLFSSFCVLPYQVLWRNDSVTSRIDSKRLNTKLKLLDELVWLKIWVFPSVRSNLIFLLLWIIVCELFLFRIWLLPKQSKFLFVFHAFFHNLQSVPMSSMVLLHTHRQILQNSKRKSI